MAIDYLESIRSESARLVAAARSGPLDAGVPPCPGWTVADLLDHIGRVQRWSAASATSTEAVDRRRIPGPPADPAGLPDWVAEGAAALVDALAGVDPGRPAWNFAGAEPAVAGFWRRRQAVEAALHRWDAESARGEPGPIDPTLAADGIDETLTVMAPFRLGAAGGGDIGGSLHVHCTDVDGEWNVFTPDGGLTVERGHAKGDAALRGPASSLLLVLWGRVAPGAGGTEVFGDRRVLDRWLALPTHG